MSRLKIILLFGALSLVFSGVWLYQDWNSFWSEPQQFSTQEFEILQGESGNAVIFRLQNLGIITQPLYAKLWLRFVAKDNTFKRGLYELSSKDSAKQILQKLIAGKIKLFQITIIPGWTYQQALDKLMASELIVNDSNENSANETLNMDTHLEGWFFPDTYSFPKKYKLSSMLKRGYETMQTKLENAWQQRDIELPLQSPYEMLILASIVEKETAVRSEKSRIAGVFTLRLKKHMRLQTDPTVIYGIGVNFNGNITKKDLRKDTPYNTYTRFGLPPTPIALPDLDSLMAVAHAVETGDLYFVADGSGGHSFSKTLKEHNIKVRKLLAKQPITN